MRYRKTCALYDEVNMGNPGNVPWCSDKGLEPDCENCTRPSKTNYDRLICKTPEEMAEWLEAHDFTVHGMPAKKKLILDWLKSPADKEEE